MRVPASGVRGTVPAYVPILKARLGEFTAIEHAEDPVKKLIRPVLEVVPEAGLPTDVIRFYNRVAEHVPDGIVIGVDTCHLAARFGPKTAADAMLFISDYLANLRYPMLPVIRPGDESGLAQACSVAAVTHGLGACIRIGVAPQGYPGPPRFAEVERATFAAGLEPSSVDVLLDLGVVGQPDHVARAVDAARAGLAWAQQSPWRSVTVAAGAFPRRLDDFPMLAATSVPRFDAAAWSQAVAGCPSAVPVGFGDYAVAHPELDNSQGGPPPTIRYADGDFWQVYRWPKDRSGGHSRFFELCSALVRSPHWPQQGGKFSWGDEQIEAAAQGRGSRGTGRHWRSYSTSHHLAAVVGRLTSDGVP
jgi:hypothetical protein